MGKNSAYFSFQFLKVLLYTTITKTADSQQLQELITE